MFGHHHTIFQKNFLPFVIWCPVPCPPHPNLFISSTQHSEDRTNNLRVLISAEVGSLCMSAIAVAVFTHLFLEIISLLLWRCCIGELLWRKKNSDHKNASSICLWYMLLPSLFFLHIALKGVWNLRQSSEIKALAFHVPYPLWSLALHMVLSTTKVINECSTSNCGPKILERWEEAFSRKYHAQWDSGPWQAV